MPRVELGCFLRRAVHQSVLSQSHLSRPLGCSRHTQVKVPSASDAVPGTFLISHPRQQAGLRLFGERRQSTWQGMHEERVD